MKINSKPYLTILTIVFGFLVINLFFENKYFNFICILICLLSIISKKISIIIELLWFKLSFILSQIIPNILLLLIFYFFLTPIALLSKLFKVKSEFKVNKKRSTYFITKTRGYEKESFKKAW